MISIYKAAKLVYFTKEMKIKKQIDDYLQLLLNFKHRDKVQLYRIGYLIVGCNLKNEPFLYYFC